MSDAGTMTAEDEAQRRMTHWLELDRMDKLEAELPAVLQLYPANEQLQFYRAYLEYRANATDSALKTVRGVLLRSPQHRQALWLRAQIHERQREIELADDAWAQLLRAHPGVAQLLGLHAMYRLRQRDVDGAWVSARQGLKLQPDHAGCLLAMATTEMFQGKARAGENILATLMKNSPEGMETGRVLMMVLERQGRVKEAHGVAQDLLRLRPAAPEYTLFARRLRVKSHWTLWPLYPLFRWRKTTLMTLWVVFWLAVFAWPFLPAAMMTAFVYALLVLSVYAFVWPAILMRLL